MGERLSVNTRAFVAMIWRDLKYLKLFRMSFFMNLVDPVVQALVILLMAAFQTNRANGLDLTTYVVVGIIVSRFSNATLLGPYNFVYLAFWNNRLEWLLMSQADLPVLMLGSWVVRYVQVLVEALALGIVGFACGASLSISFTSFVACVPLMTIGLLAIYGIGLMSASMMYHLDARGGNDPVRFIVSSVGSLVSGVYFPPDVLPAWLRAFSAMLPQTHLLRAVRYVLTSPFTSLSHAFLDATLRQTLVVLSVLCLSYITLGALMFKRGLSRAQSDGRISRWV